MLQRLSEKISRLRHPVRYSNDDLIGWLQIWKDRQRQHRFRTEFFNENPNDIDIATFEAIQQNSPDLIIHLGDIYYGGRREECEAFWQVYLDVFGTDSKKRPPLWSLPGNHEYILEGQHYFEYLLGKGTGKPLLGNGKQTSSWFRLTDTELKTQFLCFDTGVTSHALDRFVQKFAKGGRPEATRLHPAELKMADKWIAEGYENQLQTVVLSHHPPIKRDKINLSPEAPFLSSKLQGEVLGNDGRVAAWFWGHDHTVAIFKEGLRPRLGQHGCIGNGSMPSFALKDYTRYNHSELAILPNLEEGRMPQGFAIMTLKKGQRPTVDHLLVNMQTTPPTSYLVPPYKDTKIPLKIAEEMQLKALKGAEREAVKREGGRGNKNRYPIILVTGLVSFDAWTSTVGHDSHTLQQGWRTRAQKEQQKKDTYLIHYYKGVRSVLEDQGFWVYEVRVDWSNSRERRVEDLEKGIDCILHQTGAKKAHLFAHSIGGIDSRKLIFDSRNEGSSKIASLVTFGTPHLGSEAADWYFKFQGNPEEVNPVKEVLLDVVGLSKDVIKEITTVEMAKFNEQLKREQPEGKIRKEVSIRTYSCAQPGETIFTPLQITWKSIHRLRSQENDGLVSVQSSAWESERHQGTINADHLNMLGWWDFNEEKNMNETSRVGEMAKGISDAYLKEAQYLVDKVEKEEDCVHVPGYLSAPEA